MVNFPLVTLRNPLTSSNTCMLIHNGTRLTIHDNGEIILEGNVKDAALGLVKYIVERDFQNGVQEIWINKALIINFVGPATMLYTGNTKPVFWEGLSSEFDRVMKMKAFW